MGKNRNLLIVGGLVVVGVLAWGWSQSGESGATGEARVQLRTGWQSGADIAAPLTGQAVVRKRGNMVMFTMALTDAKGRAVRGVMLPNGKRPAAPRVRVVDADGQDVYHGAFQYG